MDNSLLTTTQAAKRLKVHPQTMVNWRWAGNGPCYTRKGRKIFYAREEVTRFKRRSSRIKRSKPS